MFSASYREMADDALEHNGDKKLAIFRGREQLTDVIPAEVAMNVETLVQKQLNKRFSVL